MASTNTNDTMNKIITLLFATLLHLYTHYLRDLYYYYKNNDDGAYKFAAYKTDITSEEDRGAIDKGVLLYK